jgi:alkyl sulfatase BDS1-like metallo-beta-lactamase superfamily hydrolase
MARYRSADHHMVRTVEWDPAREAERVNDHILLSRGTSSSFLVAADDGDVVINTGMPYQGRRHRERFETLLGRPLAVKTIVFTQSHPDHMGGWAAFADQGVETLVQRNFPIIRDERNALSAYFAPRGARLLSGLLPDPAHFQAWYDAKELDSWTAFDEAYAFERGGRRFEFHAKPSGETLDSMIVWMPDEKTLFTGNWMGALYGALPHFHTPRGDRDRSVPQFLRDIDHVIGLEPELLLFGHDGPIRGKDRIRADLTRIRDAVAYIHDETVKGMTANKDVFTLMAEIELPPHLQTAPGRGPVRWYVRSVFEEYTGWFRQDSTTELYATPPRAIWAELAELAGGPDVLAARAQAHIAAGRPVEALHFTDIALAADPAHRPVREAEIAALERLIDLGEGRSYDEIGWLENAIKEAQAALGRSS